MYSRTSYVAGSIACAVTISLCHGQTCPSSIVTHSWNGAMLDNNSRLPSISGDGRFIAFESDATNLVHPHPLFITDVFVCDTQTGAMTCESVDSAGNVGTNHSSEPSISHDGHWVVFASHAPNLVSGDSGNWRDIFLRDRWTGAIRRISVAPGGAEANGHAQHPKISGDGLFVIYESAASNVVPGDVNAWTDVFLYDVAADVTTRVSIPTPGVPGSLGGGDSSALSEDGRFVVFRSAEVLDPSDTNGYDDLFAWDRISDTYEVVSRAWDGSQLTSNLLLQETAVSADGRFVVFVSNATMLVPNDTNAFSDVFLRDRMLATTERINVATSGTQSARGAFGPHVSADGRFVSFGSNAADLVQWEATTSVRKQFLRDRVRGSTTLVSFSPLGPVAGHSDASSMSTDGSRIAYQSQAQNLVPSGNGQFEDIFLQECSVLTGDAFCTGMTSLCPCANGGLPQHGCGNSVQSAGSQLSANGVSSVAGDTAVLTATLVPLTTSALFFQGTTENVGGLGFALGDGLSCVGGTVIRLGTRSASGGTCAFGNGIGGDPPISVRGAVPAIGATRYYQAWYRNSAAYCTAQTFNLTNGVRIVWFP